MTYVIGILGAALLFGVYTALRPRDRDCNGGGCGACDGACGRQEHP